MTLPQQKHMLYTGTHQVNHRIVSLSRPRVRPPKDSERIAERNKIERLDVSRGNEVEGKFGEPKRKYGLDLIGSKLAETSESLIVLRFMIMNLLRSRPEGMLLLLSPVYFSNRFNTTP